MKKLFLILHFTFCLFHFAFSQSWQWGRRGGSATSGIGKDEVTDMATDSHGNVYVLSWISGSSNPTVGSLSLPYWGSADLLVTSFSCNGSLRWAKVIGTSSSDLPTAIRTDTMGHVYVTGRLAYSDVHLYPDTSFVLPNHNVNIFLIQYDTSGNFKWYRQPIADTVSVINTGKFKNYDMELDKNGDVFLLTFLLPGKFGNNGNYVIAQEGVYLVKYNSQGNIISIIKPQMTANGYVVSSSNVTTGFSPLRMAITRSGKFIFSGAIGNGHFDNFSMGGYPVTHSMFIGCFNSNGQFLWKKEGSDTLIGSGFSHRPIVNSNGNILLGGSSYDSSSFNGYVFYDGFTIGRSQLPMIVKLDSNGNSLWTKNGKVNAGTQGNGVALNKDGNAFLTGNYPLELTFDNLTLKNSFNSGYDPFLATFDAQTGAVIKLDSLEGTFGANDATTAITADDKGNVYVGGSVGAQLFINHDTITNSGGDYDFFIAKYGNANCGSIVPVTLLEFTGKKEGATNLLQWRTATEQNNKGFELQRSINGTEFSPIAFTPTKARDGNSTNLLNYNYTDNKPLTGSNYYRLKQIDKDGKATLSNVVLIKGGEVEQLILSALYPNPTSQILNVVLNAPSPQKVQLLITDMAGKTLQQQILALQKGENSKTVNVAALQKGSYIIKGFCGNGCEVVGKFVKE